MGLCVASKPRRKGNGNARRGLQVRCYANNILKTFFNYSIFRLNLKLIRPMVIEQGIRFTLRDGHVTLGTGVVTKILPQLSEKERLALTEGKKAREKAAKSKN